MANTTFGNTVDKIENAIPSKNDVASRMHDTAAELGQKASEYGQSAVDAIDAGRDTAASGLDSVAAGLHRNAERLPTQVGQYAHQAADKLGATANFVRDNTLQDVWSEVESYAKAHPGQAILTAVAMGFFAGRMLSRD